MAMNVKGWRPPPTLNFSSGTLLDRSSREYLSASGVAGRRIEEKGQWLTSESALEKWKEELQKVRGNSRSQWEREQ